MKNNIEQLKEVVIELHNSARIITQELGLTTLTLDIRECADRLNELIKAQS